MVGLLWITRSPWVGPTYHPHPSAIRGPYAGGVGGVRFGIRDSFGLTTCVGVLTIRRALRSAPPDLQHGLGIASLLAQALDVGTNGIIE